MPLNGLMTAIYNSNIRCKRKMQNDFCFYKKRGENIYFHLIRAAPDYLLTWNFVQPSLK